MKWKQNSMHSYMKEHLTLYVFVSVLFAVGVVFGALMVNALSLEQKQEITRYLGSFFQTMNQNSELDGRQAFFQVFSMHMKWIALIWVMGLSVIGLPLVLVLDFLKGVLIGFTVGYIVGQLSWKGMLFALVSVAPQNLIIIPVLIICSVTALSFSIYMIKNRFIGRGGTMFQPLIRYTAGTCSLAIVLCIISVYEAYLSPILMKWVTPMLVAFY